MCALHVDNPLPCLSQALLDVEGLYSALVSIEMPLVRVLAAMEAAGATVDVGLLSREKGPLTKRVKQLERLVRGAGSSSAC